MAEAVGITDIHRLDTASFEGGLVTQPERASGVILVNSKGSVQRQRFTIGHELGHYLIIAHQPARAGQFTCSKSDMAIRVADRDNRARRMEMEANRFSAGILMPLARFKPDMRNLGTPALEHVFALATRYNMSKEATALQYVLHHDDVCAVIVSKDGIVRRIYKPNRFPFIDVRIGADLPTPSLAARLANSQQSDWDDVNAGVWLALAAEGCPPSLQEQAYRLSGGWMMTLLVHTDQDEEEDGEGGIPDAYDVWENPRFPSRSRRR
ncbi:hypothetical protein FHS61_003328 [Altererythrobacter atlanticus]|uniref:ImmA/IrrE family metallo-endopeptidase n=1 Tax=Croceibacterium atlanticum TaxID=1267766 RepID=UPI0014704E26|nr:ImmA/IrrE family metallo-endopeptidase [Croceibacterium atlanticum]MBB5734277.1 hypothetical protein [Croceibacterium atlanticum]